MPSPQSTPRGFVGPLPPGPESVVGAAPPPPVPLIPILARSPPRARLLPLRPSRGSRPTDCRNSYSSLASLPWYVSNSYRCLQIITYREQFLQRGSSGQELLQVHGPMSYIIYAHKAASRTLFLFRKGVLLHKFTSSISRELFAACAAHAAPASRDGGGGTELRGKHATTDADL